MNLRQTVVSLLVTAVLGGGISASPVQSGKAERPTGPHLFPDSTLAFVRVADAPELADRFEETAVGRIFRDPQMRPLVAQLYESLIELFREAEERIGLSLDQILSIPQGELCFAVTSPEEGPPALVFLIDVGDRLPFAQKLLDLIGERMTQEGAEKSTESVKGTTIVSYEVPGRQNRFVHFEKEDVVVVSTDVETAKQMLAAWDGGEEKTLADNTKFTAIMRRCAGEKDERPQIAFFVDPIGLVKRITRGNVAAAAGMAMLPVLGLDGIEAAGGSITLATEDFDDITHLHLLLDSPRTGVLEMLALSPGDTTPEPWVPADVATYVTLNWDFAKTYSAFGTLYNKIRGEDALARDFNKRLSDGFEIEFEDDILNALDGRVTYIQWMIRPARMNSRANLVGVKLKDAKKFQKTVDRVLSRFEGRVKEQAFGGVTYYAAAQGSDEDRNRRERPLMRRPDPAFALVGDYLLLTDSTDLLKHVIATKKDGSQALASQLEFKLIASKIRRQPGGEKPGLLSFTRPEEGMRLLYDLATSETIRERLASGAEGNQALGALDKALRDHPLPPFAVIAKYLAPGGSLLTNDETGFHFTSFTLRRE
jgi:hypothetical protein